MRSRDIRRSFLDYFKRHGHEVVRSSPLVPQNDPSLLFTNAGMVQFKDVFTGRETRPYRRATSSQKCVRAGGKHNDLENVGRTARHHTFFEMLGNFSFGDYFKEEAIALAWQWLVGELKLDPARMVVTVFGGDAALGLGPDDEAHALWRKLTGFDEGRILGLGMADNFWMMGDTGPQGPCSEIYYYFGKNPDINSFGWEPAPDGTGWTEIWNLVFMQFERPAKDAPLQPLPRPSIDTGAGLERVSCVVEDVTSNYETDLLRPLVLAAGELAKKHYGASGEDDVSMRVLADHARATTFLIADNVTPSNLGRGYVLRRIMRRAIRHGVRLGLEEGHFRQLCEQVIGEMGPDYPELVEAKGLIARSVDAEDAAFRRTLDRGMRLLEAEFSRLTRGGALPGKLVFDLYDTYGFPADLTRVIAEERGFIVDEAGFDREMDKQRQRSAGFAGSGQEAVSDIRKQKENEYGATEFLGYQTASATGRILAVTERSDGTLELYAERTPFYGEAGGQVGDTGVIENDQFQMQVENTEKTPGGLIAHLGRLTRGRPAPGAEATFTVDAERRDRIRANHSATHLLHLALKEVLGEHVAQKGSLVAPDRLRFDFAHFAPMTEEERRRVEEMVNDEVLRNLDSEVQVMGFDEARRSGAVALFGEKYGDQVRVMRIGARSVELCGGTHVRRAGDIGLFKIVSEVGIAQGVRRIEAVTGKGALAYVQKLEDELGRAAERTRAPLFKVAAEVERLQEELKAQRREVEELKRKIALGGGGRDLLSSVREVGGIKVLATRAEVADPKALREVADQLRDKLGSGVVVLGGVGDGKVALVAAVTADLTARYHAGKIIGELAKLVGGKGGGRPDLAQGGGPDAGRLDEALESVFRLIA
jgi:alanyl-tRNA synthetase